MGGGAELTFERLHQLVTELGWQWHPDDYDPTDDQLLALVARVRSDALEEAARTIEADGEENANWFAPMVRALK